MANQILEPCEMSCPHCGSEYLSHEKIEVFERKEDSQKGLHVTVTKEVKIDDNLIGNTSHRRNAVTIQFRCENCGGVSLLSFSQDKGRTLAQVIGDRQ